MLLNVGTKATTTNNQALLGSCLVLARQLHSYKNWFKVLLCVTINFMMMTISLLQQQLLNFGKSKQLNKKNMSHLISTLTSLVPHEPVDYLRVN